MAFYKFAESTFIGKDGTYLIELHAEAETPLSSQNFIISSDVKKSVGTPNKDKFSNRVKSTKFEFKVRDFSKYIMNVFETNTSKQIQGKIYKDGSLYFHGWCVLNINKFDFTNNSPEVTLVISDGLTALKTISATSSFNDTEELGVALRKIFALLDYTLDVNFYWYVYRNANNPSKYIGIKIKELILNVTDNYYDLLEMLCNSFDFTIFQEDAVWVVRQDYSLVSTSIKKEVVNSSGSQTATTANLNKLLIDSNFLKKPEKAYLKRIGKVSVNYGVNKFVRANPLNWLNSDFKSATGWTIDNTYAFYDLECLKAKNIDYTYSYYTIASQEVTGLKPGDTIILEGKVSAIRMILSNADISEVVFFRVLCTLTDAVNPDLVYYLRIDSDRTFPGTWSTNEADPHKYKKTFNGKSYYKGGTYYFLKEYDAFFGDFEEEIQLPSNASYTDAKIKVEFYGGSKLAQSMADYPNQEYAQFDYFNVRYKMRDSNSISNGLRIESSLNSTLEELEIDAEIKEGDPFSDGVLYLWNGSSFEKMFGKFSPDDKTLLEYLAERTAKLNIAADHYYDVKLMPDYIPKFNNRILYNSKSYLVNYYERYLSSGKSRIILLPHDLSVSSTVTKKKYLF